MAVLAASFFFSVIPNSFAENDLVRNTGIDENGRCQTESLDFGPYRSKDLIWEIDNPTCIAFGASVGVAYIGTEFAQSALCGSRNITIAKDMADISKRLALFQFITAHSLRMKIKAARACSAHVLSCIAHLGTNAYDCPAGGLCCSAIVTSAVAFGVATAELAIIHAVATGSQKNAHICGERWDTWEKYDADNSEKGIPGFSSSENLEYTDINEEKQYWKDHLGVEKRKSFYKYGKNSKSYRKYIEDLYQGKTSSKYSEYLAGNLVTGSASMEVPDGQTVSLGSFTIKSKYYREFIYGGMEFEGNGSASCPLPEWDDERKMRILGYSSGNQRYYMRGPNKASNYACGRYLLTKDIENSKAAYECCKKASQETMCIEDNRLNGGHVFCAKGQNCSILGVSYEIFESKAVPNRICAKTYSVCPYNHNLGGGTEIIQRDNKYGIMLNHCQYLKHCVKIPDVPYIRTNTLDGGWISSACFDLKGDSQNNYSFNAELTPLNKTKNFSAPIAQCFKETMENMFLNKAGNTKCTDPDEAPGKDGECESGYIYQKGEIVEGQVSFFQTIQNNLRMIIKLVMTLAIVMLGIKILLTGKEIERKEITMFVIKLGLVSYFALGTAWQDHFFTGVSSISADLSTIFMKMDDNYKVVDNKFEDEVRNLFSAITSGSGALSVEENNFEFALNGCDSKSNFLTLAQITFCTNNSSRGCKSNILTLAQAASCLNGLRTFLIYKGSSGANDMNIISTDESDQAILEYNINKAATELVGASISPFSFSGISFSQNNQLSSQRFLDGCQFPKYNYADKNSDTSYDNPAYPPGKEYLKVWDMLDCKIVKALGFGPNVSTPNLVIMIVAGLLTSGLGMIFFVATFIFAFYLIALTVRALHIFLIASIAITILIYISPLTITACLFDKTKDIYNGWKDNLISFVFQPLILFVYIGLVIVIFEKVVIGDAQFAGSGRETPKTIVCSAGDAVNNSIYCIFNFNKVDNNNALSALGIALVTFFDADMRDKLPTIIKSAFLMYILTQFLAQIPGFSQRMLGGLELSSSSGGTGAILIRSRKVTSAIQSRGSRAVRKWTPRIARSITPKATMSKPEGVKPKSPSDGLG
ncbi:MAG: type IV secretory pathway VirB6-like protein [Rickettsiales bacterium]|jgi:type IV secretory pathway VirB6-like protein